MLLEIGFSLFVLCMINQANAQSTPPAEDEFRAIRKLNDDWLAAVNERNVTRLIEMITDDVVFLPPGLPPVRGKIQVEMMFKIFFQQFTTVEQTASIEELQVVGDWAFTWGSERLILVPSNGGGAIELEGRGMSIVKRQLDGSWKFARGINNSRLQSPQKSQ